MIKLNNEIRKKIKSKKETINKRKSKFIDGKADIFTFNDLKISEHNE